MKGFNWFLQLLIGFNIKYVTFIPCKPTCTALDLANMFYYHIICKFDIPKKIVSDRYSRFLSKIW